MNVCKECRHSIETDKRHLEMPYRFYCLRTSYMSRHPVTGESRHAEPTTCVHARSRAHLCGYDGRWFERNTEPEIREFRRTVIEDLLILSGYIALMFCIAYALSFFGVITL